VLYNFLVLDTAVEVGNISSAQIKIKSAIRKEDTLWLNNKNNQASESSSMSCFFYA
jgi:hypothetical protein